MTYVVTNNQTNKTEHYEDVNEVAELVGLDVEDIEWAIEEHGRCDGEDHWVVFADFVEDDDIQPRPIGKWR